MVIKNPVKSYHDFFFWTQSLFVGEIMKNKSGLRVWINSFLLLGGPPTSICHFFKGGGGVGGERAKTSPEWKLIITSMTHHISRTVYHMIMILRYMWAMNSTKWTILVYHASYLMNHTLFDCYLRYICVKWWSLGFFFILSKFSLMCSISHHIIVICGIQV